MEKYNYLRRFISGSENDDPNFNIVFGKVLLTDIILAEKNASIKFPKSLKEFWLKIGHGWFRQSINSSFYLSQYNTNDLFWPKKIADIINDPEHAEGFILHLDHNEEMLENGFFPFFEECDSSYFLWMKPGEDKVYDGSARIIENNFEDFIYKLYHVHPQYYLFNEDELKAKLEEEKKQLEIEKQERGL